MRVDYKRPSDCARPAGNLVAPYRPRMVRELAGEYSESTFRDAEMSLRACCTYPRRMPCGLLARQGSWIATQATGVPMGDGAGLSAVGMGVAEPVRSASGVEVPWSTVGIVGVRLADAVGVQVCVGVRVGVSVGVGVRVWVGVGLG